MFDGDKAMREGAQAAVLTLSKKVFVRVTNVEDGRQPDHLSKDEHAKILASRRKAT